MIVVDTSALIAIATDEPEAQGISEYLESAQSAISVASIFETHMVLSRRWPHLASFTDRLVTLFEMSALDVTSRQVEIARAAFDRYGKGMGHPAQLTFGDCFAYALAKSLSAPLLFKGADFAKTDVKAAIY